MAVITRYIVVRNGIELEDVFEDKKDAEAYDKMLDAADRLSTFIKEEAATIDLAPEIIDALSVFLAKNGPEVSQILKGIKGPPAASAKPREKPAEKSAADQEKKTTSSDKNAGKRK